MQRVEMRTSCSKAAACIWGFACFAAGCRIQSQAPYWIETHGQVAGQRVAGWSKGALLLGTNQRLWAYPGGWANPWPAESTPHDLRAIAASNTTAYAVSTDGRVLRFADNHWSPVEGSASWNASEIAATVDDRLLVLANGKLSELARGHLQELDCNSVTGSAVAGAAPGEAFLLDQQGALYLDAGGRCEQVPTPIRLQRIAGLPDRLLAVGVDGSIWRRRANAWARLPEPFKYRAGQVARGTHAQDVGVSTYTTWVVDHEGSVFLLSDET
jgi:hypothetical protein